MSQCISEPHIPEDLIEEEAVERLAQRLATPLQIEYYLGQAFEEAHKIGLWQDLRNWHKASTDKQIE